jgi:ATP-dependent DNA ligase
LASHRGKFDGVYLARKDADAFVYAGKVERGFSERQVKELKESLKVLRRSANRSRRGWRSPKRRGSSLRSW